MSNESTFISSLTNSLAGEIFHFIMFLDIQGENFIHDSNLFSKIKA
jgi:hypothetical protein